MSFKSCGNILNATKLASRHFSSLQHTARFISYSSLKQSSKVTSSFLKQNRLLQGHSLVINSNRPFVLCKTHNYLGLVRLNNNRNSSKNYSVTMPPVGKDAEIPTTVEKILSENKIVIFSKTTCPWCVKVKELFAAINEEVHVVQLDTIENGAEIKAYIVEKTEQTTVPNVFIRGNWIGGFSQVDALRKNGTLDSTLAGKSAVSAAEVPITNPKPKAGETTEQFVNNLVKANRIVIFSKSTCPFCLKVKDLFKSINETALVTLELDEIDEGTAIRDYLFEKTGQKTVPNVFINGDHLGGSDSTFSAHSDGRLAKMLATGAVAKDEVTAEAGEFDYDLIVMGGGSGGLSCSKTAASLGAKVAVLDFVKPTPIGTTWGLGGTCVNVGCIPKKLMHQSALLGEALHDSKEFGWETPEKITHNWQTMKDNIVNYVKSLNFGYKVQLKDKNVEYHNGHGQFIDKNKLLVTFKNGKVKEMTARKIVVATGGRPKYPDNIKGASEFCITSDDLFSLAYNPGKTLCVGASYVSLECAGFLRGIGLDVTVMVRSILLRGFDQQMANKIGTFMEENAGVQFIRGAVPTEITRVKEAPSDSEPGEYLVKYKTESGEILSETYNTIVMAVGRDPCTKEIDIVKTGVKLNPKNQKIITTFEQTNIENIYAIGDVIDESSANGHALELTPVAIKAGELLAKRLFGGSDIKMDYNAVATTVFTPLEYGSIGFSEEDAIANFGEDNIEVYHAGFWPLEWTVAHKPNDICYAKLICNISDNHRVIGLHVAGPNAGEITQGYALAFKLRATKQDFDMMVGIHPTCSETFSTLKITKRSGEDVGASGC